MDRLTKIQDYGVLTIKQGGHADVTIWMRWDESRDDRIEDALLKLAEYEDTGLMPDEVARLQAENKKIMTALEGAKYIADIATARSKDLENSLAESQRRERAAVEDLSTYKDCDFCIHVEDQQYCHRNCQRHVDVDNFRTHPCWEWRGPQEGEPHETV